MTWLGNMVLGASAVALAACGTPRGNDLQLALVDVNMQLEETQAGLAARPSELYCSKPPRQVQAGLYKCPE